MTGVRHNLPDVDEARALGEALVAVSADLLKPVPGIKRRWFKGGEPYLTLTVDEDEAGLVFVEVCVRGRFVRRRRGSHVETGHTDELELTAGGMPRARLEAIDERTDVFAVADALLSGAHLDAERAWLRAT